MITRLGRVHSGVVMAVLLGLVVLVGLGTAVAPAQAQAPPIRAYLCLEDSGGTPLTPGTSRYTLGSTYYFDDGMEGGCLYEDFPAGTTNVQVWTSYNNTTSAKVTQDISSNPTFSFQTNKLTLKLATCGDAPLSGGTARFRNGATTYFFPAPNSTAGDGTTAAEMFPGTYDFEMSLNGTSEWKTSQVVPDADHEIAWTTTTVTIGWPGQVSYGGPLGDSRFFAKPAMEMLPGTVRFHLRPFNGNPGLTTELAIAGCTFDFTPTAVTVAVDDCAGGFLPGVEIEWFKWGSASTRFPGGTTTATGPLTFYVDGDTYPNIALFATYKDRTVRAGPQQIATNPAFAVSAVWAEVDLQDNVGGDIPIVPSNNLRFYAWGFANSKHAMELVGGNGKQCLLPGDYIFWLDYAGETLKSPRFTIGSNPYVFTVAPSAVRLLFFGVRE